MKGNKIDTANDASISKRKLEQHSRKMSPCIEPKKVYEFLNLIPSGRVVTYAQLAKSVGHPGAARTIGKILGQNPNLITIPCHRIVRSDGSVGGYALGEKKKIQLLQNEGLEISNGRIIDFDSKRFQIS